MSVSSFPGQVQRKTRQIISLPGFLGETMTATRDSYKPFFPSGKIGEEIHYTNYHYRSLEQQHIDYSRPSSILYRRTPDGLKAVGVMYSAPTDSTPEQLNAIAPLSVATWHRHVDF